MHPFFDSKNISSDFYGFKVSRKFKIGNDIYYAFYDKNDNLNECLGIATLMEIYNLSLEQKKQG